MKRYKFLRTGYKSEYGDHKWVVGKWYSWKQPLELCRSGFHCSKGIYQAFSYVPGEYLAEVEVKGKSIKQKDKEVWEKMRVVKVWKWRKIDSVLFAIYAARLVLKKYEDQYPNDKRPRQAIEAAEAFAKSPTETNRRAAAEAAGAAAAAWAAAGAAAAAEAAEAAGAAAAAWAARSALYAKLDNHMKNYLPNLKILKQTK